MWLFWIYIYHFRHFQPHNPEPMFDIVISHFLSKGEIS